MGTSAVRSGAPRGKRRRAAVDYRKLHGELFGDSGGDELDDEVVWRPGMSNKSSGTTSDADSNDRDGSDEDEDLKEAMLRSLM